jgi:hypothetical protein
LEVSSVFLQSAAAWALLYYLGEMVAPHQSQRLKGSLLPFPLFTYWFGFGESRVKKGVAVKYTWHDSNPSIGSGLKWIYFEIILLSTTDYSSM